MSAENEKKATFLKLLNNLFESCSITAVLIDNCRTGLEMFPNEMRENRDSWIKILLLMSMKSSDSNEREKYGELLIQEAKKEDNQIKM